MGKAAVYVTPQISDRWSRNSVLTPRLQRVCKSHKTGLYKVQMNKCHFKGTCLPQTVDMHHIARDREQATHNPAVCTLNRLPIFLIEFGSCVETRSNMQDNLAVNETEMP